MNKRPVSAETSITVPYGTVQSFAGVLSNYQGVPLGGQAASVELQSSANGADSWTRAAGAGEVSPSGTYQASAGQVTQGAYFRMHFLGTSNYTESTGAALHVNVAKANTAWAGVSSAPSAVLAGGTSVISGTLNSTVPGYGALAEKTSHVRVQRLSGGTSWVDDPAVASEDSPGHYRATVTVSSTSQYRLVFEGDVNFNTASSDPVQVAVVAPTSWSGVTEGYTVGYNGATLIARVLSGVTGIGGQTVVVQSSPSGLDGTWSNLGLAQEDLFTPGRYFAVVNTTRLTFYRLYFQGSDVYLQSGSPVTWVLSKASVGTPVAPSRVAHGRYFKVYGALYPAHPAGGKVLIKAYRYESRRWRLKQQFWVSAGAGTKYSSTRIKLRYAGSYRLYAYHADADHLATQSGYRRLTAY